MNTTSRESVSKTDERIDKLADQLSTLVEIVSKKVVTPAPVKAVEETCVTCGGAHSWYNCPTTDNNQASVCATTGTYNQVNPPNRVSNQMPPPGFAPVQNNGQNRFNNIQVQGNNFNRGNNFHASTSGTLPSNTIPNPKGEMKAITTRSGVAYEGPSIPTNPSPKKVVERETEETTDKEQTNFQGSTAQIPPSVIPISILEPDVPTTLPKTTPIPEIPRNILMRLAEGCFCQVGGKFHFPTDFVVVDFEADPRVPLILGRSFLRTGRALIDVYGEEITLRVDSEAVTFNLDQTTRYSSTNDKSVNRIDIIDAVCEEYAPELLGFPNSSGGNPTPTSEPFTSEFILEEIKAYLKDDSISPEIDHADCNPEEDICLIEKLLNNDPFQLPPMDLKQSEVTEAKSSIEEPPELELKDLPSHLEYAFLEENDKLPVIIAKGLKNDEKDALLKVLKSHKRAIAWKITDIKGIDPRFCTHKILMEDDYKPTVQSQRRVNPKIHEMVAKICGNVFILVFSSTDFQDHIQITNRSPRPGENYFHMPVWNFRIPTNRHLFVYCSGTFSNGVCWSYYYDMIENTWNVFRGMIVLVFGNSFDSCLSNLEKMLKRCKDINLVLNWEKCHFMCKEGIMLGHKISEAGIDVDHAKIDVIAKLSHPTTVKGVRSFLGHAGFYRRFIRDFSKIARPMTHLLEKETPFVFSKDCIDAFPGLLKKMLTESSFLSFPDWNLHFRTHV
ncbi:reverse transcriptase domain-containing protein [Tanacetum coccineum]